MTKEEKVKEYNKQYRLDHKEEKKEYNKQYRLDNKESLKEYHKEYRLDNKERIAESCKQYRLDNKESLREYHKEYRLDNKERVAEYNKRRYDDPSTGVKKRNQENSKKLRSNPVYRKHQQSRQLKVKYGITLEERDKMIQDQDNKCARCGLPFGSEGLSNKAPVVDHDHSFEKGDPKSIRGILHHSCNILLGHHKSPEEYQLSVDYLKKYGIRNDYLEEK